MVQDVIGNFQMRIWYHIMSLRIGHLKIRAIILICVNLRTLREAAFASTSVFICGKNLTNDDNRQFDDLTHVLTMQPDLISFLLKWIWKA